MIFVAVGTQLPFDRLIEAVDTWPGCGQTKVYAQVGEGKYIPKNIEASEYITAMEFAGFCQEAEIIVAHAGMGAILTAREYGKPLIIMPRSAELGEHRNDHQLATAKRFGELDGIYVATSEGELHALLDKRDILSGKKNLRGASKSLIRRLCAYIDGEE